jgi:hypothetical protein
VSCIDPAEAYWSTVSALVAGMAIASILLVPLIFWRTFGRARD